MKPTPYRQEHLRLAGAVHCKCPVTGQRETGITDDFGNLSPVDVADLCDTVYEMLYGFQPD